jgi:hypothetical protein
MYHITQAEPALGKQASGRRQAALYGIEQRFKNQIA